MTDIIRDYKEEALSLVLPQFSEQSRLRGLIKSSLEPTVEWQSGLSDIYNAYDLHTSVGAQLDKIGKLLNVSRLDAEDDDYRARIKAQIIINKATGSGANLIEMLKLVLGSDARFSIVEQFPASVQVIIYTAQNVITEQVVDAILPIGVRGVFFTNPYEGKTIWTLSDVAADGSIPSPDPDSVLPDVADLDTTDIVIIDVFYIS